VRYTNVDYGGVVGLTLQLDHRTFGPFSLAADYTWQQAIGNSSEPDETLNRVAAGQDPLPRQVPFNWDQRHTLNFTLTAGKPGSWSGSTIVRWTSGQPYTPTLSNATPQLTNSARKPNAMLCDVRLEYPTRVMGVPASAFARAFNLFDSRFFNGFVFPSSGSADYSRTPDEPGQAAQLADPTRYYAPRRIEVGVTLRRGQRP
jgi:hypothetical protein